MAELLVIFDCDGVLVDSEPIANRVLAELASEAGLPMSAGEARDRFLGATMPSVLHDLETRLGRPQPSFLSDYAERLHERLERELEAVPGARAALEAISQPMCVASNGEPETVRLSLAVTGLSPHFAGNVFSARDAGRGKPHPDLFLHAARTMGFAAHQCVVIEDSLVGVSGARAAGMATLGYAPDAGAAVDLGQRLAAAGAKVFNDMAHLPGLIAAIETQKRGGRAP